MFGLTPSNTPGHRPLHVPLTFCFPLVQHVKEPVAGDGEDVGLAALGSAAAGLVFNGRGGGTRRLDVGVLLVCKRPVDGFSWSAPGRALQADALVVVQDVVLQDSFPELLPAGPTARLCTCLVDNSDQQTGRWRPTRPARRREAATPAVRKSAKTGSASSGCEAVGKSTFLSARRLVHGKTVRTP